MNPESLWVKKIAPALDNLFNSAIPTNPCGGSNPAAGMPYAQIMDAYTAIYNLYTSNPTEAPGDLYRRLDGYLKTVLDGILPKIKGDTTNGRDGKDLLERYLLQLAAYHGALNIVRRIFAYLEQHFVDFHRENGTGWLKWRPYPNDDKMRSADPRYKVLMEEWGLPESYSEKELRAAETSAEIATEVDCIIGVKELGLKRWRTQVFDVLFESENGPGRGQISVALDDLLADTNPEGIANRTELIERLDKSLEEVGVKSEHPFVEELAGVMRD